MKNQSFEVNGIKHTITVSPVTIDEEKGIYVSQYQKDKTKSIMLRQVINDHTIYPSARISNEKQDNIFDLEDFGFTEGEPFDSVQNRVAFMDVPETSTLAQLKVQVAKFTDGCIYRQLSNRPILTSGQVNAISNPELDFSLDKAANAQAMRYPKNDRTIADGTAGKLILDSEGKITYRANFFSRTEKADIDERGKVDYYVSPELAAELTGKVINASLVAEQGL